jgi:hypothetical protein
VWFSTDEDKGSYSCKGLLNYEFSVSFLPSLKIYFDSDEFDNDLEKTKVAGSGITKTNDPNLKNMSVYEHERYHSRTFINMWNLKIFPFGESLEAVEYDRECDCKLAADLFITKLNLEVAKWQRSQRVFHESIGQYTGRDLSWWDHRINERQTWFDESKTKFTQSNGSY